IFWITYFVVRVSTPQQRQRLLLIWAVISCIVIFVGQMSSTSCEALITHCDDTSNVIRDKVVSGNAVGSNPVITSEATKPAIEHQLEALSTGAVLMGITIATSWF